MRREALKEWSREQLENYIIELRDYIRVLEKEFDIRDSILENAEDTEADYEDFELPFTLSDDDEERIIHLQNQHQQDCIRINDLTTTVHVLAGLYSALRKNVGMD